MLVRTTVTRAAESHNQPYSIGLQVGQAMERD